MVTQQTMLSETPTLLDAIPNSADVPHLGHACSAAKRQRTLLAVTYHFPPSAASGTHRLLGFSRHLPACGWNMAVVAPPSLPWEMVDPALVSQIPESTQVFPVEYHRGRSTWPLRKFYPYAAWLVFARRTLAKAVKECRPDVILTSGPPHCVHMAGLYLKRRFGIPWVADFRDPWVAAQFLRGRASNHSMFDRLGESLVFGFADAVIVNAPNALSEVVAHRPNVASKIHCVTNGFDPELFAGIERRPQSQFVIAHLGELYAGRDPRPFLDAVRLLLGREPALRQRLCIDLIGNKEGCGMPLATEIEARGLTGIVNLVGQVSYRESLQRMVDADLLLLFDTPNRRVGVPAKLYEYLGARRPILALGRQRSDVHWVLGSSGVPFRLVATDDVAGIASALEFFLNAPVDGGPQEKPSQFSRAAITARLVDVLDELPKQ